MGDAFGCQVATAIETLELVVLAPSKARALGVPRNSR